MSGKDTRQALISAAVKAVRSGGTVPSLQQLARAAGLTTGAVYSQFGNRALLLLEVAFTDGVSSVVNSVEQVQTFSRLQSAIPAGASLDPLVVAIVEAANEPSAASVAAARIQELFSGDRQREGRLSIALAHALLAPLAVPGPTAECLLKAIGHPA